MEATLTPALQQDPEMTVGKISLAFLSLSISSILTRPLVGWLCDDHISCWLVSCLGCSFIFTCFTFLGPYITFMSRTITSV